MTPKEKAQELISRFEEEVPTHHYNFQHYQAIKCALICVEEILKYARKDVYRGNNKLSDYDYLISVKSEIEK